MAYDKIVLVTRKTRLQQLVERFNSRGQAKFYIEHAGGDFADYQHEDEAYARSLDVLHGELELGLKLHEVRRELVPNYLFAPSDLVVAVGQDGLVANVGKYVGAQPVVPINPDPARFDGILLPFQPAQARTAVTRVLEGKATIRGVTLAEVTLGDGQRLLAFNDLFIGARTHVSARYALKAGGKRETQSSSGVLISTGAGSTGWLSSVFNMAAGIAAFGGGEAPTPMRLGWDDPRLVYVVREPYASKSSGATLVAGVIGRRETIEIESQMPADGVIFSDGVEADALAFNSGAIAKIRAAEQRTQLVVA